MQSSFVTEKDIVKLNKLGVNYKKDIKIFIKEMKDFLKQTWSEEYSKPLDKLNDNSTIDDFNNIFGKSDKIRSKIIEHTFSGVKNIEKYTISEYTKVILSYFYSIEIAF